MTAPAPTAALLPATITAALDNIDKAFYQSVPFQRVARVNVARAELEAAVQAELRKTKTDAFLAAARICESRSRTLRSKPAAIESLQCGSAIQRNGFIELERLLAERLNGAHSTDACATEDQSVGTTTSENE